LTTPLLIRGAPGSPYSRKMVALLRYRHIPYRWIMAGSPAAASLPAPKVELLPTLYFPAANGELEAVVDSTPLIRRLETMALERSVLPPDPVMAFLDELLEDFADEWLTKAMFHYRWHFRADIDQAAALLPRWRDISAPEAALRARGQAVAERQIGRLYVVGSNAVTAPVIEASYARILDLLRTLLEAQPFLLGRRPGAADFGFYGQLTQLALFDPTPMALALRTAPRVHAWTMVVDDLSGLDPRPADWLERDGAGVLRGLLAEFGRCYAPVLLANAAAIAAGSDRVSTEVDGRPWVQQPFPYQARCLMWLRQSYHRLDTADRAAADALLAGTGIEALWR
jgi:glutathione S-transferase